MTPHQATREANAALRETGLTAAVGKVFSRKWEAPGETRTVIHMIDASRREQVIAAVQERFDDIVEVYRLDRDDSVATYCALAIHRLEKSRDEPPEEGS